MLEKTNSISSSMHEVCKKNAKKRLNASHQRMQIQCFRNWSSLILLLWWRIYCINIYSTSFSEKIYHEKCFRATASSLMTDVLLNSSKCLEGIKTLMDITNIQFSPSTRHFFTYRLALDWTVWPLPPLVLEKYRFTSACGECKFAQIEECGQVMSLSRTISLSKTHSLY